jgi:hypothetical protein
MMRRLRTPTAAVSNPSSSSFTPLSAFRSQSCLEGDQAVSQRRADSEPGSKMLRGLRRRSNRTEHLRQTEPGAAHFHRSITPKLCDFPASDALQSYLQSTSVWMPGEGRFEPLLQMDFLDAFEAAGQEELIFVPEFPHTDPIQRLNVSRLSDREDAFPSRGTLVAPDASFLLTVDWDSFFTLFYGPRAFVTEVARKRNLEGFFATPTTEHFWFNYSLGCCVVTLAPEAGRLPVEAFQMTYFDQVSEAAAFLRRPSSARFTPKIGIVLGSGLGAVADAVAEPVAHSLRRDSPLPAIHRRGPLRPHCRGACWRGPGRRHAGPRAFYEGYTPQQVTFPMRVLGALGVARSSSPTPPAASPKATAWASLSRSPTTSTSWAGIR